ncbi:ATP-binding protein [Chloroflexota bacterium]
MVNPYEEHERLFSDSGLKLGKVLGYLLNAAHAMEKEIYITRTTNGGFTATGLTEFGEEVGKDEIHWWVYKKEANLEELQARVKQVLLSAQSLKEASRQLDTFGVNTYADLVTELASFVKTNHASINELYELVAWLHAKDPLAPSILFSYRVWGSTRRSDRWLDLNAATVEDESEEIIKILTEIACGLFQRGNYTRFWEMMHIGAELHDSDPENYHHRDIPEAQVVSRTAHTTLDEFVVFFEELRDSLRNIELDIEKCLAEKNLLRSESFWRAFILKASVPGRVESVLWDFKESLAMWHVPGARAQVEFCKLVAAFANNEGGMFVIGVTDASREIVGVNDLENRMKVTSEATQRWLDYPRKDVIVHFQPVFFQSEKVSCLVVAVAQAAGIVGVRGVSGEYYYPDRVQTGLQYRERQELETRKMHQKAGDNFGFMRELEAFLYDK